MEPTSITSTGFTGALSGNATTATTLQNTRTIGGVSFDGSQNIDLPGVNTGGNQDTSGTAAKSTTITVTENSSTDETVYLTFVDGSSGNKGIEVDTGSTYNPSSGLITTGSLTTSNNVIVGGNLTVNGTTTTVNSNTVNIGDNILVLNSDETGHPLKMQVLKLSDALKIMFLSYGMKQMIDGLQMVKI